MKVVVTHSFRRPVRAGSEHQQMVELNSLMESVSLSQSHDRWICDLAGDGEFRVKEVRNFLDNLFLPSHLESTRWVKYIPIKVNVFAWRARRNYLPTRANLNRRGIILDSSMCPLCQSDEEDINHVLFRCELAQIIVRRICRWWELDWQGLMSFSDWQSWFSSIRLPSKVKNMLEGVFCVAWWSIWGLRNRTIFNETPPRRSVGHIIQRYPRLYALEVKKTVDVVSKLSQENLTWSFRRAPRSGVEQDQLTDLTTYVEGLVLGVTPDRWYWTLDGSGEFSVASARKVIDDNRFPEVSTQTRWIKAVPIKVNIHAWKVRMDCLPTRLNISRRGIDIPSILCPVCGSVTESSSHLFFDCLVAKDNFRKICRWWEVDFMEVHTFDEWVSWIVNLRIPIKHKRLLEGVCFGLWWLIWAYRNKCVFGVVSPSKADIFDDVVSYSFYWSRFRCNVSFSWVDWLKNPHLVTL
ncbi:RNA-directed DNA polymerase, eukaryota [Tanacetum coccineum]